MTKGKSIRRFPIIVGIFVMLAACDAPDAGGEAVIDSEANVGQAEPESVWTYSEVTDPFTDLRSSFMTSRFVGEFAFVDVVARCNGSSKLSYRFTTFDEDGTPLRMSMFPSAIERELGLNMVKSISYRVRVDRLEPMRGNVIDPRHDNSFVIGPDPLLGGPTSVEMKSADMLTVGLKFDRGDDTIFVDQTDLSFRAWLDRCGETEITGQHQPEAIEQRETLIPADTAFEECLAGVSRVESKDCLEAEIARLDDSIEPEAYVAIEKKCRRETTNEMNAEVAHLECIIGELNEVKF